MIIAWRGTNSLRSFDAQNDHSAQPLLTHSDRTASSTGAIARQTERTGPVYWSSRRQRQPRLGYADGEISREGYLESQVELKD